VIERVEPEVDAIVEQVQRLVPGTSGSVDVRVALGDGRSVSGTVPDVAGDVLRTVSYSRVNPRHRIAAWVRLLALGAAHPGRSFEAITVGRAREGADRAQITVARIAALDAGEAREQLAILLDLFDRGMRQPLPLYCATAAAWAGAQRGGADPHKAATAAWESRYRYPKEDQDDEHTLVLGRVLTFAELLDERPGPGEDWSAGETSRLGQYARRMWDGLLEREQVTDT
jgi:exodeoxyribonuclease V gamma subunit